ncbi:MAG: hypothetical protein WCP71_00690 [Actinomycetes bacterium]|jgi:uncharacterized membrane protein
MQGTSVALFVSVFFACAVEAVEAVTIVLAAGTARDWKSAWRGVIAGLLTLALIIAAFGPAISHLPISFLRIVVGGLLLVFGLTWLRKAILRSSGYKALHDEDKIFQEELAAARIAAKETRHGVADWYAFTLSYKGVLLEGLEVAFIVLTFGTIDHKVGLASIAALAAVAIVVVTGFALRTPLSKVPENTMKFGVGILLTAFGIFWGAEGSAGASKKWPGDNWAVLGLIVGVSIFSFILVQVLKVMHAKQRVAVVASTAETTLEILEQDIEKIERSKGLQSLISFGEFWVDFIVGDDWRIAAGIVIAFVLTATIKVSAFTWGTVPFFVALFLAYSLSRVVRSPR